MLFSDDCEYELYDVTYKMTIGQTLTSSTLQSADPKLWCSSEYLYIPFYTYKPRCLHQLKSFCKSRQACDYEGSDDKGGEQKPGVKKLCWKEHVVGKFAFNYKCVRRTRVLLVYAEAGKNKMYDRRTERRMGGQTDGR